MISGCVSRSPNVVGVPTVLTATASGEDIVYSWNLGDGSTGSGSVVTHTYASVGSYTAVVTASNGGGIVTATTNVVITPVHVWLPLVMRNYAAAPDLVVQGTMLRATLTFRAAMARLTWSPSGLITEQDR